MDSITLILMEKLWPYHTTRKLENPNEMHSFKIPPNYANQINGTLFLELFYKHANLKIPMQTAFARCVPLRRFAALGLFESKTKPSKNRLEFQQKLCSKFIELDVALNKQLEKDESEASEASMKIFLELCKLLVDELDPKDKVFVKKNILDSFGLGSKSTSKHWGGFLATGIVSAASAIKYHNSDSVKLSTSGEVIPMLGLAIDYYRGKVSPNKVMLALLTAASQMLGEGRHSPMAQDSRITPLAFNVLPFVFSLSQSKGTAAGVALFNMYLTMQDYVHSPQSDLISLTKTHVNDTILSIFDAYSNRSDCTGYLARHMPPYARFTRTFWRHVIMDPEQVSEAICKDIEKLEFQSITQDSIKKLANKLRPTAQLFTAKLASNKYLGSQSLVYCDHDNIWDCKFLQDIDGALTQQLKTRLSPEELDSDHLVKYVGNETSSSLEFIKLVDNSTQFSKNLDSKFIPSENFLTQHQIMLNQGPSAVLLLVMFQNYSPDLKNISLEYWKKYLSKTTYHKNVNYAANLAKLSIAVQQKDTLQVNKRLLGELDELIFKSSYHQDAMKYATDLISGQRWFSFLASSPIDSPVFYNHLQEKSDAFVQVALVKSIHDLLEQTKTFTHHTEFSSDIKDNFLSISFLIDETNKEKWDTGNEVDIARKYRFFSRHCHFFGNRHLENIFQIGLDVIDNLTSQEHEKSKLFQTYIDTLMKSHITVLFPVMGQNLFLDLWNHKQMQTNGDDGLSHNFLKQIYNINKDIFWLPFLAHVVHADFSSPNFVSYANMIKELNFPREDAALYLDLLYDKIYYFHSQNFVFVQNLFNFREILEKIFYNEGDKKYYFRSQ